MKNLIITTLALVAFAACAETAKPVRTPEQIERTRKIRAERYRAKVEREGGIVISATDGKDVKIVNAQSAVAADEIADIAKTARETLRVPFEIVPGAADAKCPFETAEKGFEGGKTAGVIALVANEKFPTLTIRPEDHTAIVNVTALAKDSPDAKKLASRVRKEIWRGIGYALGAANASAQPCVMREIASLSDLDEQIIAILGPESLMRLEPSLRRLGTAQIRRATYKRACEEGWASAPTNEWQKAVWEKVKAEQSEAPTKGIKIKYDKNKGK